MTATTRDTRTLERIVREGWTELAIAYADTVDRKFTTDDLLDPEWAPTLNAAAEEYANTYAGTFEFMRDMKEKFYVTGWLTPAQAKGVLNCLRAEVYRNRRKAQTQQTRATAERIIPNGTYTVVLNPDTGEYITVEFEDDFRDTSPDGSQTVKFLSGPDNSTNFTGCAFLQGTDVRFWKRYRDTTGLTTRVIAAVGVLANVDDRGEFTQAYAERSSRCARCQRKLTVPASLAQGLGPECAKKAA